MSSASRLLVAQAFRHVAIDDAQGQTLDDRGLADAGLADEDRIILGPARQHLDCAANFLVAPDHRIEFALPRRLGQIPRIFLQGVVSVFGGSGIRSAAFAQVFNGLVQVLGGDSGVRQDFSCVAAGVHGEREQKPLDRHKGIAGLLRDFFGAVEQSRRGGSEIKLACAGAFHAGQFGQSRFALLQRVA